MQNDFKAALARVQSDYDFYIRCQADPDTALADYALSPEERAALGDPDRLAEALKHGSESMRLPSITIKISGTHDWVNRAAADRENPVGELIQHEVDSIRNAGTDGERDESTLRLMQLLG